MNRAALLIIVLIGAIVVFAVACGGVATPTAPDKPEPPDPIEETKEATCPTGPGAVSGVTAAKDLVELEISVNGDTLQFDKERFEVAASTEVAVTFNNASTAFQHNWVLVKEGTKNDVASRGSKCRDNGWVQPEDPDVIARTKLLDPGEEGEVRFTVPPAGEYQFVCTFPGHNAGGMFGMFVVTP